MDPADTTITFEDTSGTDPVETASTDVVARINSKFGTTVLNWQNATVSQQPVWNGSSVQLDGVDDLLAATNHSFSSGVLGTTFTVRFRVDDLSVNRCTISYSAAIATAVRFRLQINSSGGMDLSLKRLDAEAVTTLSSTPGIISVGVDYTAQVTVNFLTGAVAFYLDGVAAGTGTYPGTDGVNGVSATTSARSRWFLNNTNTLTDYFDGKIGAAVWAPSVLGSTDLANCRGFVERNPL